MAKPSGSGRVSKPSNLGKRRIRDAFTFLVVVSSVALAGFVLLTQSTILANLGPWESTVLFAFSFFFAALSYKGADTAMFGAYVMAYFVAPLPRGASSEEIEQREKVWGLRPYLRQDRGRALAASAMALVYGVASLLAYLAFFIVGSFELAKIFDWQRAPSIVGLVVAVLTLVAAVPAALGSIAAMRTYFSISGD